MFVLVEDSAQTLVSPYVQAGDLVPISDRLRQRIQWPDVRGALVGPVGVVEGLEPAQSIEQVVGAPYQGAVEEFTAAGLYPPFHDRVAPHRQLHPFQMIDTAGCG